MAKRRCTICMLVPFIIIATVVGLFFTVTDPTSWPEKSIELSATDMRIAPHVSTIWCESVAMTSSDDFVAYRLVRKPKIDKRTLTKQTISLKLKMDNRGRRMSVHDLKYYLLPGSIINVHSCATRDKARVYIYKHEYSKDCLQCQRKWDTSEDDDDSEDDDESKDDDDNRGVLNWMTENIIGRHLSCSKPLKYRDIMLTYNTDNQLECQHLDARAFTYNVTSEDVYIIVITNENRMNPNHIRLQIWLDRTLYNFQKLQKDTIVCGGASSSAPCNVPLSFASTERVLIWIPQNANSYVSTRQKIVTVNSQCRPRIALFATLTVLLPVVLFVVVSFVLKSDRKRTREQRGSLDSDVEAINRERNESFAAPLLPESTNRSSNNGCQNDPAQSQRRPEESQPPSYEALFDLPPPYASLKVPTEGK